jgi:O-acetyl-ADP-ribose deacetylase (regulator of RNase III)
VAYLIWKICAAHLIVNPLKIVKLGVSEMIMIVRGDILECTEDIICHQVNTFGAMGGGLAWQISQKYPKANADYEKFAKYYGNDAGNLLGRVNFSEDIDWKIIANMFSQHEMTTDYVALRGCLQTVKMLACSMDKTVALPYNLGCGIADGDWNTVYEIIEEILSDYGATIYKLKEERNESE